MIGCDPVKNQTIRPRVTFMLSTLLTRHPSRILRKRTMNQNHFFAYL
jgi:hypothetical protein